MKMIPRNGATASHTFEAQGAMVVSMFKAKGMREGGNCMQPSLLAAEKDNSLEVVREEVTTAKVEQRFWEGRVIQ